MCTLGNVGLGRQFLSNPTTKEIQMIGRGTTVGLSLLCALFFSAIVVQSASAAKAVNTTAVTCAKTFSGGQGFSDPHCDKTVFSGAEYEHKAIPADTTTEIETDNTLTGGATDPAVLAGKSFGVATEITCNKVSGTGTLHNTESEGKFHTVTTTLTTKYTECSVQKPLKCDVKEPIEFTANVEGFEEGENMGINFKPAVGETFVAISYINNGAESCVLNGKAINLTGSAVATSAGTAPNAKHSGATSDFDHAKLTGRKTLLFGGVAAGLENTGTVRMKEEDAIAFTTTT